MKYVGANEWVLIDHLDDNLEEYFQFLGRFLNHSLLATVIALISGCELAGDTDCG